MTVVGDYSPAVMLFWDLQEGQERFYEFHGATDGYCQLTYFLSSRAIVVFKNEDHIP